MKRENKAMAQMQPYVCARDVYKQGKILLDANENSFASRTLKGIELNRYPDPDCTDLRKALGEYCKVREAQLLVGNGSDEIISLAIKTFCQAGDEIVTVNPSYSMYAVCALAAGILEKATLLDENFELDVKKLVEAAKPRAKIVFITSPNSPVGNRIGQSQIRQVLESLDCMVFVDEAYFEYCGESVVGLVEKYDNLVVSRTLSKAWGLAALRVGYCISNPENISAMRKAKLPYNVNGLSQAIATKTVTLGKETMRSNVRKTVLERQKLAEAFKKMGLEVFPSVANFVTVRFPKKVKSKQIQEKLAERGIIIRDRSNLPLLSNCARITVGTPEENRAMLELLKKGLKEEIQ